MKKVYSIEIGGMKKMRWVQLKMWYKHPLDASPLSNKLVSLLTYIYIYIYIYAIQILIVFVDFVEFILAIKKVSNLILNKTSTFEFSKILVTCLRYYGIIFHK